MELSLWANHPKDQPSFSFRDRPYDETNLYEGRQTPSVITVKLVVPGLFSQPRQPTLETNRRSFWAFLMGLRPPCLHPSTRNIILKGHPMSLSEANSFQLSWGEPTHGLSGLYLIHTSGCLSLFSLYLIVPYSIGFVKNKMQY